MEQCNCVQPEVVTKYKAAADICNRELQNCRRWCAERLGHAVDAHAGALQAVIDGCKDGAKVVDLCRTGDTFINK